uniref:Prefoldin subunit 2 n=1 Tax=Spongospora subterranea TaxID=70186 RepID=A0A0H5R685_9EUKA|eukprot:CRZ09346.1 hypothetical protein [Spongospora subterranea]
MSVVADQAGKTPDLIVGEFEDRRRELSAIFQKMQELDGDRLEHELVIKTLSKLEPERECYRLVNNVLVRRTVGEVLPSVDNNNTRIGEVMSTLNAKLKEKEEELNAFKAKYGIVVRGEDVPDTVKASQLSSSS